MLSGRGRKFDIVNTPIGKTDCRGRWFYQKSIFYNIVVFPIARERVTYSMITSVLIKLTVANNILSVYSKPLLK